MARCTPAAPSTSGTSSSTSGSSTSPSGKTRCCQWWHTRPLDKKKVRVAASPPPSDSRAIMWRPARLCGPLARTGSFLPPGCSRLSSVRAPSHTPQGRSSAGGVLPAGGASNSASAPRSAASSRFSVSSRISCVDSTRSMSLTRRENPDDTRRARDPTPPSRCSASWPTERSSTCSAAAAFCVEPAAGRSIAASPRLAARSSGQRVAASARGDRPASKLGASSRAPCSMRRVASSLKSRTASESRLSCGPGQKTSTGTGEPEATSSARAPSKALALQ
mmetsp:Transcript_12994/g.32429  ORF Transcript_12994/g.32429 Transcript_12994/m.32429 type:complete len:277 (-) Transcript_12994:202-1032(-)